MRKLPRAVARCGPAGRMFSGFRLPFSTLLVTLIVGLTVVAAGQEEDRGAVSVALAPRAEILIIARCSVCHSPDLITQQRLPKARWESTIEKMKRWGTEISIDESDLLLRYLSARYHPDAPDRLPPLEYELGKSEPLTEEPANTGPIVGIVARGAGIFEHNCQACHGAGAMGGMGPKLVKSPVLKQEEFFWETVLHGRGSMPAWGAVLSQQDIADIHAWLSSK